MWKVVALLLVATTSVAAADERNAAVFEGWRATHAMEVKAFADFLAAEKLLSVQPLHEVLRSASDWKKCGAEPFAVPPPARWPDVAKTLMLVERLKAAGVLAREVEIASGYRPESLASCADSKPSSAHTKAYAVDLLGSAQTADGLCTFWKQEGRAAAMGLSKYQSGRIHIDANGYRTWGNDCTCETSYCQACTSSSSAKCK